MIKYVDIVLVYRQWKQGNEIPAHISFYEPYCGWVELETLELLVIYEIEIEEWHVRIQICYNMKCNIHCGFIYP